MAEIHVLHSFSGVRVTRQPQAVIAGQLQEPGSCSPRTNYLCCGEGRGECWLPVPVNSRLRYYNFFACQVAVILLRIIDCMFPKFITICQSNATK